MKVNQKPHTHSKEPKLVPQLPEMLRQQAPRRLKFNNNLSVANQVGSICMFHLPSMELGTNLLLRLKRNPRVDQGDLKCLLVQCLLCIARHRIKHVVYASINPKFVSWAPGRRGFLRKAHRRTTYQRVFSSKCSAVDFSHRKNAATVPSARWIGSDSACVEVR